MKKTITTILAIALMACGSETITRVDFNESFNSQYEEKLIDLDIAKITNPRVNDKESIAIDVVFNSGKELTFYPYVEPFHQEPGIPFEVLIFDGEYIVYMELSDSNKGVSNAALDATHINPYVSSLIDRVENYNKNSALN